MNLIGRFFVIFFSLILAILIAGLALAFGVAIPDVVTLTADPIEHVMVLGGWFFATGLIVFYGFGLMLIAVAIAETFDIRSIFYYAVGGAAIGAFAYYTSDFSVLIENSTDIPPVRFSLQLAAAAGIIGGFVYWLCAGRNAGRWKTPLGAL
jgi:phosphotransferase system  glucose/maltose/N-acetylglucosamine-specific IIC component